VSFHMGHGSFLQKMVSTLPVNLLSVAWESNRSTW
jgi:hypothetical protein